MSDQNIKNCIARKVASLFSAGDVVNLGIGIPTLVGLYVGEGVVFHTENGLLGYASASEGEEDEDYVGAGAQYLAPITGAAAFDSAMSFAIVRGGHLTATVLGALEVDEEGNIANWSRPGRIVGMGGAMDLVTGAKQVIVAMEHTAKGTKKIIKHCTLPLTGTKVVTKIVTELCVIDVTPKGLVLKEIAQGITVQEIIDKTDAKLIVPDTVGTM
jgi:3-oxoacid CoA-transferase B subunit